MHIDEVYMLNTGTISEWCQMTPDAATE